MKKLYFVRSISIEKDTDLAKYINTYIQSESMKKYTPVCISHTVNTKGGWSVEILFKRKEEVEKTEIFISEICAEKTSKLEDKINALIEEKNKEDFIPIGISHVNTGEKNNCYSGIIFFKKRNCNEKRKSN